MTSNIVNFDGDLFFNRHGLNEIGISPEDSEAIYTYLLTQHKMHDGITGYIFINSVINVRLQRSMFNRLKLLEPEPFSLKRFFDLSWEFLREIPGGYTYIPMKLCGFFKVLAPYKIGNNNFSELYPLNNVYVNGHKVGAPFSFLILEGDLVTEPSSCVTLLKKPITPNSETFKRIENELFFFDPDIVTAAKYQITGFDPTTVELPHPKKFKTGEPIDNANPPEKQLIASEKYRDRPSPKGRHGFNEKAPPNRLPDRRCNHTIGYPTSP